MEDNLKKTWRDMVCLSRPYPFKLFKGCLPQNLLSPLLNILTQLYVDLFHCRKTQTLGLVYLRLRKKFLRLIARSHDWAKCRRNNTGLLRDRRNEFTHINFLKIENVHDYFKAWNFLPCLSICRQKIVKEWNTRHSISIWLFIYFSLQWNWYLDY